MAETASSRRADSIAVVGMSGRFPGADSVDELWKILIEGRAMHRQVPPDRFDVSTHVDPSGLTKNASLTPWGAWIERPGLFDSELFNVSPKEASRMDPQHRLLLMTCYEALENAGYQKDRTPSSLGDRISAFLGCSSDDWRQANLSQEIDPLYVPSGSRSFGPGRLNYYFKWEGPSYVVDTACSSSAAAIQMATNSLKLGDCDTAVVAGSTIATSSDIFAGHSLGGFLSPTGPCKTFLEGADGYCRADAVVCIVLKRLEDAEKDNDNILGTLQACASRQSAYAVSSMTRPHAPIQERLYRDVLKRAGLEPNDVDYVEMHGTGTIAGDAEESKSVADVFMNDNTRTSPLYVGTLKPNVGHSEAAAGIASVVKALLMLRHGTIPPHIINGQSFSSSLPPGFTSLIPKTSIPLGEHKRGRKVIMCNSFSASGGNTSIVLQEYTSTAQKKQDTRDFHVITVSAKSFVSLHGSLRRFAAYVEENQELRLADLTYSTTARRMHHGLRLAYVADSRDHLLEQLQHATKEPMAANLSRSKANLVFVFSGQGSSHLGIGKNLYLTSETFRHSIDGFVVECLKQGFPSILPYLLNAKDEIDEPSLVAEHLALAALEIGLFRFWTNCGLEPNLVIGHSLGEFAALYTAGSLSLENVVYLVGMRAHIMQAALSRDSHGMLLLGCGTSLCRHLIEMAQAASCEIACQNTPNFTVIGGSRSDLEFLRRAAEESQVSWKMLDLPFAYHSKQMDEIMPHFEYLAASVPLQRPRVAYASSLLGCVLPVGAELHAGYVAQQTRHPVVFSHAAQACKDHLVANEPTLWIEIGPSQSCISMIRSSGLADGSNTAVSLSKDRSPWMTISNTLARCYEAGIDVNWPAFHREYEIEHLSLLPDLPTYDFDLKNYWIQYEGDWMLHKGRRCDSANEKTETRLEAQHDPQLSSPSDDCSSIGILTPSTEAESLSMASVDEEGKTEQRIREVIAEELELPLSRVTTNATLVDLGLNSLIGMSIAGRLKRLTFVVPGDAFVSCQTVGEICAAVLRDR